MRRILIATLASLALGLPLLAAPAAQAQTEDTATATPAQAHHARHHRHRRHHHHHHAMAAEGLSGRPDLSGSAGTGTSSRDTTGAQTSLPGAVSNQAPNATR